MIILLFVLYALDIPCSLSIWFAFYDAVLFGKSVRLNYFFHWNHNTFTSELQLLISLGLRFHLENDKFTFFCQSQFLMFFNSRLNLDSYEFKMPFSICIIPLNGEKWKNCLAIDTELFAEILSFLLPSCCHLLSMHCDGRCFD